MLSHYAGLDFAFLYAKDLNEKDSINAAVTSEENLPKINTWIVQEKEKVDLLLEAIDPMDLQNTCAVIVLDLDQPWEMMTSLQSWFKTLQETIFRMLPQIPLQVQDSMKNKLLTFVKTY